MANDVYEAVREYGECVQNKLSEKCQRHLQLLPACDHLQFVTMPILGPLPKTLDGKQSVMKMRDRYLKLKRAIITCKTTDFHNASLFMDNWVVPYVIHTHELSDNRTQFISKFFQYPCAFCRQNT